MFDYWICWLFDFQNLNPCFSFAYQLLSISHTRYKIMFPVLLLFLLRFSITFMLLFFLDVFDDDILYDYNYPGWRSLYIWKQKQSAINVSQNLPQRLILSLQLQALHQR